MSILMTPKFGLDDDGSTSNFDAKLVLATMLTSQLHKKKSNCPVPLDGALNEKTNNETGPEAQQERSRVQASAHASEHTENRLTFQDLLSIAMRRGGADI
ncbi:uncharacterized protein LOC110700069 isoform X2 [Chenopodium quinoa]|uniref:uncharacterized protein LOC110700069 isoform X2 n=1 Tax=Chenopodium quinoa TaxID=63459 RepID=UPI000B789063|nr:uncharacterized protein LOC110700069 isoform X2 [Chenopodium quinoa]